MLLLETIMLRRLINNTPLHFLIVFVVAVIAHLPTLNMYFYLDEWGALYDFTHHPATNYLFTTNNYYLLFKSFGLNATGYYAVGIFIYALSAALFYLFVEKLFKNKTMGLIAGILYATSPVGTSTATMLWTYIAEGGYPLSIMLLLLLYFLLKFARERKLIYFVLVAIGFAYFLELEPRRVFLFLPVMLLFDYIISNKKLLPTIGFFVRQAILFGSFVAYYNYDIAISEVITKGKVTIAESLLDGGAKLDFGIKALTHMKPLVTLTNVLLGGPWVLLSSRLTGYVDQYNVDHMRALSIVTCLISAGLVILAWKVKREWGLISLFSLAWVYFIILGFYIFSSPGVSDTAHRTLSPAAPGYALFFTVSSVSLFTYLKKKKVAKVNNLKRIFILGFFVLAGLNLFATHYGFNKFVTFYSKPARAFYKNLKNFYPTFPPNSLIYIETPRDVHIKYQLSRIYGGNPYGVAASVAVFYPEIKKEELLLVTNFVEVEKFVNEDPSRLDHTFGFYFDKTGLQNKTEETRASLRKNFTKERL